MKRLRTKEKVYSNKAYMIKGARKKGHFFLNFYQIPILVKGEIRLKTRVIIWINHKPYQFPPFYYDENKLFPALEELHLIKKELKDAED